MATATGDQQVTLTLTADNDVTINYRRSSACPQPCELLGPSGWIELVEPEVASRAMEIEIDQADADPPRKK
ncbi:hypothetical protein [Candidatus Thiosymbion oneisti]|uniref:hypothetical protein n=1 Tax=Candidatus Thiosymbion oneisti TaxID=589554 RepID=UPI00105F7C20|nr:hypothetical protein [Candidatus Thiosymbion oneisti]